MTSPPSPPGVAHLSSLDNGNDLNSTCWDLLMLYTRTVAKGSSLAAPCPPRLAVSWDVLAKPDSRESQTPFLHSCLINLDHHSPRADQLATASLREKVDSFNMTRWDCSNNEGYFCKI